MFVEWDVEAFTFGAWIVSFFMYNMFSVTNLNAINHMKKVEEENPDIPKAVFRNKEVAYAKHYRTTLLHSPEYRPKA